MPFMLKKQLLIHKIYFYGDNSWRSLPLFPLLTRKEGIGEISRPAGTKNIRAGDLGALSISSP